MCWRSAEWANKMRCGLGRFNESVYNTPPRGGSDGNGPDQPLLRKLTAAKLWRLASPQRGPLARPPIEATVMATTAI
jgi:hypothetical protein